VLPPKLSRAVTAAALVAALGSCPALALEVSIDAPRAAGGHVWADLTLGDLFPPRVEQSLARGMPATLLLHVELWRRRNGWFDRLESTYESPLKIRYEVWTERFMLEQKGAATIALGTLDSLQQVLSRPLALPVGRIAQLAPGGRYYLSVSVTLKPLSVEDLEEGEGWLSGEVETRRHSGFGIITGLPRSVFDAVRNFAGFGDQRARVQSDDFDLSELTGG
jgi:hypothetical protein